MLDEDQLKYDRISRTDPESRTPEEASWFERKNEDPAAKAMASPTYSLELSQAAYDGAVLALHILVETHLNGGMDNPAEFMKKLTARTKHVETAFKRVQKDLATVNELVNVKWFGTTTYLELMQAKRTSRQSD